MPPKCLTVRFILKHFDLDQFIGVIRLERHCHVSLNGIQLIVCGVDVTWSVCGSIDGCKGTEPYTKVSYQVE